LTHKRDTSGLCPNLAADCTEPPVAITARIDPEDKDWLKSLPEGASYHIRQAVRAYKQNIQEPQ
jgi:hypothetical protein